MRGFRLPCVRACFADLHVTAILPQDAFAARDYGLSNKQILRMQALGLVKRVRGGRVGNERAWRATEDYWRVVG